MIINVLMPTYNDERTIQEALDSLKKQDYTNWHLYIINDGSTDNTEKVVNNYIKINKLDKKITYIYEENKDQLNALKNGFDHIPPNNGLVYLLHSDDTLASNNVFSRAVDYFSHNDADAIIANYNIMNGKSEITGYQKVKRYNNNFDDIALLGLWLGRNLFVDFAFWKYEVYKKYVSYNYLTWNTPFWLCHENGLSLLDVKNVDFPFFNYRVFEENYINNEIGLLNVLNGEIRTLLIVLSEINIPFYRTQYYIYRIFNKLKIKYKVIYMKKKAKKIYKILKFVIGKRIKLNDINKYPYFEAILNFFKNRSDREISIKLNIDKNTFTGADVRIFNKKMLSGDLPQYYYNIFLEMNKGFTTIKIDKENYDELVNVLKYLSIFNYVKIIKK